MTETINPDKFELSINNYKFEKKKIRTISKEKKIFYQYF